MSKASQTFTYTSQRSAYISIISAMLFMALIEESVIILLIAIFVHNTPVKLALFSLIAILDLLILSKTLSPLWTHHTLNETHLQLRYGLDFKAHLLRTAILTAQPVQEKLGIIPGTKYEAAKHRIIVAFSEKGQLLLTLDQSYPFRIGLFSRKNADRILINVDQRDQFLAALGLPTSPDTSAQMLSTKKSINITTMPMETSLKTGYSRGDHVLDKSALYSGRPGIGVCPVIWAIQTENLTRRYQNFVAVDNLNLAIRQGEIYGFLGANGAGKTTTMKMLVGLLQPTTGRAQINSHDVWAEPFKAKAALGYVADKTMLYERLTGREFLAFLAQMRCIPQHEAENRIEHLLTMLELTDRANSPCGTYSFGMKRKLALASALLHQPPVLILDEPLNGLDPLSAHRLKTLFGELATSGTTIFLSTHDLATAESICHRIGIIHKGRLLVEGSAQELRQIVAAPDLESVFLSLTAEQPEVLV